MSRIDQIAEDIVQDFIKDPERLEALERKKDEYEELDLDLKLMQTQRPRPMIRVAIQDTPVNWKIMEKMCGDEEAGRLFILI